MPFYQNNRCWVLSSEAPKVLLELEYMNSIASFWYVDMLFFPPFPQLGKLKIKNIYICMCIFKRKVFGKIMLRVLISKKRKRNSFRILTPRKRGGGGKQKSRKTARRGLGKFSSRRSPPKVRLRPTIRIIFFLNLYIYTYRALGG